VRFFKAHALGNDYLVAEGPGPPLSADAVRAWCDRHRGIGADGILEPLAGAGTPAVRIWNPDGSIAEKSGNGLRIFAWTLATLHGAGRSFVVTTAGVAVPCVVDGNEVSVGMGRATVGAPVALPEGLVGIPVSVGNPHCVVWRSDEDLDALPWRRWGALVETHPSFPGRTNVQLARLTPEGVELRIWERGAGPTSASGSSACAVVAAAVAAGARPSGRHRAAMPGGALTVDCSTDLDLVLTGPVTPVGWFTTYAS
jgi:diaminopimelate epimerase